jgi:hypothetical protein
LAELNKFYKEADLVDKTGEPGKNASSLDIIISCSGSVWLGSSSSLSSMTDDIHP